MSTSTNRTGGANGAGTGTGTSTSTGTNANASTASPASTHSDNATLARLHGALLLMLKDFSALCARENLTWVVMYGTAIGVLRHKGFIPWDDDVDIAMSRDDLEKLTAIVQSDPVVSERYCMVDAQLNPRYPMATSRFMLRDTEFRDANLATMDFESGIFLDLFPLDDLADNERAFRRQVWRAWLCNKLAIAKLTRNPYVAGGGAQAAMLKAGAAVARGLLNLPGLRSIRLNERSLSWQTRYRGQRTRRVGYLCDTNRFWDIYDREDLFPVRMAAFEDMEVPLARRAEKLLSALYGDFMTPPPENARAEHYPEVLDLGPWEHAAPLEL